MTKVTITELPTISDQGKIAIRPFFDPDVDNLEFHTLSPE